jgi:ferredoxin-fold anticodon binding domain-containing protein
LEKSKKSDINKKKIKIVHKMADGTIRDSIDGYEIPYNEKTAITYRLLEKWADERQEKTNN